MRMAHLLFEQSGTFKNEFRRLGINAEDYDIQNEFGETDNVVDLFAQIDKAYEGQPSLFDGIKTEDVVMAFFPCTRFEAYNPANFQGKNPGWNDWTQEKKLQNSMALHSELNMMYEKLCKLFCISLRGGWEMVVENPYTQPHYLTMYFPVKPGLVDKDRSAKGDYFKKPTQYWFINGTPRENLVLEPLTYVKIGTKDRPPKMGGIIDNIRSQTKRSMISPHYARRFILENLIDEDIPGVVMTRR